MANQVRIETLTKDYYDSWSMQVEALMTKNDTWKYASGEAKPPVLVEGDAQSEATMRAWRSKDKMAKSDLILSISPTELQQIRGCNTSREIWLKLESIHASNGPPRKATLLKQLTLQQLQEGQDVREHLLKFFDAVDKLNVMGVQINEDLLSIMLLYSLLSSYKNFRCAIESHDKLPSAEALKVKIIEESEARIQKTQNNTDAMAAWKGKRRNRFTPKGENNDKSERDQREHGREYGFKRTIRCYKCQAMGHKAINCCKKGDDREEKAAAVDDTFFVDFEKTDAALYTDAEDKAEWCLDSGCTSHICRDKNRFAEQVEKSGGRLNLANNESTSIAGKGKVNILVTDGKQNRNISLEDTLFAPEI